VQACGNSESYRISIAHPVPSQGVHRCRRTYSDPTSEREGVTVPLSAEAADRAGRVAAEIAALGPVLPGTILARSMRCRSPGCHCHADPPHLHGPYWFWTRKVEAKTVSQVLSRNRQTSTAHGPKLTGACGQLRQLRATTQDTKNGMSSLCVIAEHKVLQKAACTSTSSRTAASVPLTPRPRVWPRPRPRPYRHRYC
jgi:hypothetical protein